MIYMHMFICIFILCYVMQTFPSVVPSAAKYPLLTKVADFAMPISCVI